MLLKMVDYTLSNLNGIYICSLLIGRDTDDFDENSEVTSGYLLLLNNSQ